jgi:hypothetical protein
VVSLDDGDVHFADHVEALFGIGVIADDIAEAGVMRAFLLLDIGQNDLKRLKIGVNVGYDCKLHAALPYNFKSAKPTSGFVPGDLFIPNKMVQTRLANRLPKRFQFFPGPFRNQFDPATGQIADRANHVETVGDRFHGVTESDALHLTRVKNLYSPAIQLIQPRQCSTDGRLQGGQSPRRRF